MVTQYKTPGVYIQEPTSFPPLIVGVDTAVPCFIGYTAYAIDNDGRDLSCIPREITSMAEFERYYGGGFPKRYYLEEVKPVAKASATPDLTPTPAATDGSAVATTPAAPAATSLDLSWGVLTLDGTSFYTLREEGSATFNLYNSMRLFFANGGGRCFIISCGSYGNNPDATVEAVAIKGALAVCTGFVGPTMVAVPDAVQLSQVDCNAVTAATIKACAAAGDRIALLDVWGADKVKPRDPWQPLIDDFRTAVSTRIAPEELRFAAAYFPPLVSSIVTADEIDITNFSPDHLDVLTSAIGKALLVNFPAPTAKSPAAASVTGSAPGGAATPPAGPAPAAVATAGIAPATTGAAQVSATQLSDEGGKILAYVTQIADIAKSGDAVKIKHLTQSLLATVPGFQQLRATIATTQGVLPTCGAIAGVWTLNDKVRGVWNAPANTGIAATVKPLLPISDLDQENLNAPVQGMPINAIRTFQGRGSLIWGARTLDSLSNDWRYIQVRRTMIYVEQSVKQALEATVFRPNTAQTWVTVTSMIESFLYGLWTAGGLMGASADKAYTVLAGLGSTMTPDDVLNGVLRVQIKLQVVHPAEFIELSFSQVMRGGA